MDLAKHRAVVTEMTGHLVATTATMTAETGGMVTVTGTGEDVIATATATVEATETVTGIATVTVTAAVTGIATVTVEAVTATVTVIATVTAAVTVIATVIAAVTGTGTDMNVTAAATDPGAVRKYRRRENESVNTVVPQLGTFPC